MENAVKFAAELHEKCALQEQTITTQKQKIAELTAKVIWFEEQFRLSQHRSFGRSSEQQAGSQQLSIFNEAEVEAKTKAEPTIEEITYRRRKKQGKREEKLENLPVETIEYRLSDEERVCSCCGGELHEMSTEVRQELKIIPAEVSVVKHVRHVYACRRCERENVKTPIVTAPMPKPVLPQPNGWVRVLPPGKSEKLIYTEVSKCLQEIDNIQPLKLGTPVELSFELKNKEKAAIFENDPRVQVSAETVIINADNYKDAYVIFWDCYVKIMMCLID
jgi:hypothetical protein